ncbi:MAG: zinc ABC transporter substrate-binding protein [Candidatus Lokiarchaeota archaeon]|nr:zinc ABC transporter substrate-binding protein [Candidatus Lokiarchaeota archaeon]
MNGTHSMKGMGGFTILLGLLFLGTLAIPYQASNDKDTGVIPGGKPAASAPALDIVTTMLIPYDIVVNVAGEVASVQSIVPAGVDIHTYQGPTPTQVQAMEDADLIVSMGLEDLEPWLASTLGTMSPTPPVLELVDAGMMQPDPGLGGELNPHVWLDPNNVKEMASKVANELVANFSLPAGNVTAIQGYNATYQATLDALLLRIQGNVSTFAGLKVVSMHAAFTDLFRLLGVNQLAIVENVEGQEPTQARLDEIIGLMQSQGVAVLVTQPEIPVEEANSIAKAGGSDVATLHPFPGLEAATGVVLGTYIETMDYNLYALANPAAPPPDDYTVWIVVGIAGGGIAGVAIAYSLVKKRRQA